MVSAQSLSQLNVNLQALFFRFLENIVSLCEVNNYFAQEEIVSTEKPCKIQKRCNTVELLNGCGHIVRCWFPVDQILKVFI